MHIIKTFIFSFLTYDGGVATPCCPSCDKNSLVGIHGFRYEHPARRIVGLNVNYYIMSRRYICHDCKFQHITTVNELNDVNRTNLKPYTFTAYNSRSLALYPFGYGDKFPAFLTWRSGVDKVVIDLMRSLFDKGLRPKAFASMLL